MAVNEMLTEGILDLPFVKGCPPEPGDCPARVQVQIEHSISQYPAATIVIVTDGCQFEVVGVDPAGLRGLSRMFATAAERLERMPLFPAPIENSEEAE